MQAPPLGVDGQIGHHFYTKLKNKLEKHFNKFGGPPGHPVFFTRHPNLYRGQSFARSDFYMTQGQGQANSGASCLCRQLGDASLWVPTS